VPCLMFDVEGKKGKERVIERIVGLHDGPCVMRWTWGTMRDHRYSCRITVNSSVDVKTLVRVVD
jgi:hypothetical protein